MARARSRRVQAQRKFAQGAYVPPNVVAVVAADSRREAPQDPRNVTINNVTATGLLDVVALQSAASSPDRNGHSHLTSQPVVIVERLRGKELTCDVLPPPSLRETVETRPWEYPHERVNNNVATIKKPAEPPKLQTVKKKKEYKRDHPMLLRSRRPSKLELNRLIAESCAPLRKVTLKRKKNSSDEDEPLIFQKNRLKQTAKQLSTSEISPINKPCKKRSKKEITTNEVTTHETTTNEITTNEVTTHETTTNEITTNEVTTHETTTKEITRSKTTTNKMTTNDISLKETDRRNTKQSIARKTPMKRTRQKRIHKKCSPKQPALVPEMSIPDFTITVIKEDFTDETVIQNHKADRGTPDQSVIEVVPDDPLSPDVLDTFVAPVATDDLVVPPVPVMQDVSNIPLPSDLEDLGQVMTSLNGVLEKEGIVCSKHVDNSMVNDNVGKSPETVAMILHILPAPKNRVPEDPVEKLSLHDAPVVTNDLPIMTLHDVQMINDNVPEDTCDVSVIKDDVLEDMDDVPMTNDDVPEDTCDVSVTKDDVPEDMDDVPMTNDDVPEDTYDVSGIKDDEPEDTYDVPVIKDDVPEDTDYVPMTIDDAPEDTDDVPMTNDDVPEDTYDVSVIKDDVPEDTGDPDVPLVREDVMDSPITNLRIDSPEPGPSGMSEQFKVYNSSSDEYDVIYCDHPMYLRRVADEPVRLERARNVKSEKTTYSVGPGCRSSDADENVLMEIMENTAAYLERTRNVQSQTPTPCVASECRSSDADEQALIEIMENTAANLEPTRNVQSQPPTPCVASECRSSDADEQALIEIMENTAANLERTRNVQSQPPTPCVASECRSSDADEQALIEIMENTAANLERTRNVQSQPPTPCVASECRSSDADEQALIEIMENTAANLERTRNVQSQPPTPCVASECRSSDADEQALIEIMANTAANLERTRNVQSQTPTPCVASECRSSDADEQALIEIMENTAANLERTRNVQSQPPTPCVASECRSSDADEHVLMEIMENTAANLERTRNVQSQPPTPCVASECRSSDADEHVLMEIMENTAANLERTQNVQLVTPMPCAAAACRSDKDVINASKEFLDSRCKVCKPCIRIDKLMKVSALLKSQIGLSSKGRQNKAAVQENEPTERAGETEDVELEIDSEEVNSTNEDRGNIYLLLPNLSIMMKLRANMVHGKEVLGVGLVPKNESLINKEFSLEGHETLLDQIIDNLTIYPDVSFEGRDVNLVSRDVNLEGREVNSEVRHDNTQVRSDNTEGRHDNLKVQNDIPVSRSISILSDSTAATRDTTTKDQKTPTRLAAEKRRLKRITIKKLAEMHERMKEEKEREIARVQEEKRREISRITAEKNSVVAQISRYHERIGQMEKEKERDFALLKVQIRQEVISKIEATRVMCAEVDGMAADLAKEKDAKKMDPEELSDQDAPGTSGSNLPTDGGLLVEAPVYHPTEEDFRDPLRYYEKIWPEAVRFGLCKVVPPPGWTPPFRVHDEMRFDVTNQYISRLFNRWGPAARELCAIKLSLAQQKVNFTRPPLLDGVEVNLPKLYHLVQRHGGLETVYNKKRWGKVAEDMKFNKGPNTERKLDQIYVKYLLPYDTLSHQERQDIMRKVEIAWNRKNQKLLDRALKPLNRQLRLLGLIDSSDDETEDEETVAAVNEAEDCIIKGAVMNRAKFRKIATMMYENIFGQGSEAADPPDLEKIEEYYWRLVTLGTEHVCVHTAAIDTGEEGYGFIKNKSDSYGRHPWNPKMVSQNPRNVLKYLGHILGVTVPTLLLGMLFSTSCWHKDPHAVAWLEFQLLGPERIWYGIPADQADNFRKAVETLCPTSCQNKFHWLPSDITMIPPNLLREHNVTLSRVTQRDGEYILAFPNAYTCCISTGYTESESVYFAPPSWLESLWTVFKEARESCEPTMFAMEHLLYNIGKDSKADPTILKIAQPLFDKMLREEVTNRQMLQERGLPFVQELLSANSSRKKNTANPFNPRDQDECEYCRATLYLSKVKGLTGRNTVLCLEHALKLLDTEKYKDTDVNQLQVLVHVSVKELNSVHDDMKRRLATPTP